jgi:hypothetical protein
MIHRMNRFYSLVLFLLCGSPFLAAAQDLRPGELVAMKKYPLTRIDSLMKARGFEKKPVAQQSGYSVFIYTYVNRDSGVMRSLNLGLRPTIHVLSLEYGVWSAADSAGFAGQLDQEGFKRRVTTLPVIGTTQKMQAVSYKKGMEEISYNEHLESGQKLYLFSVSNENYR